MTANINVHIDPMKSLNTFLAQYKLSKDEKGATHTSLSGGKWKIPSEKLQVFIALYEAVAETNPEQLHMTEAHKSVSPILIDFDFKQGYNEKRLYNVDKHIIPMMETLTSIIKEYVESNDYNCFLLEKPHPRREKTGLYKDGIHLIFPGVITIPPIQFAIREQFLKEHGDKLKIEGFTNCPESIYDSADVGNSKISKALLRMSLVTEKQ